MEKLMSILIKNTYIIKADGVITGSIAIKDGIIESVGDTGSFKADTVIDGSNFAAMPGLVNAHTHSPMGLLRNLADDLNFDKWLFGNIIPAESRLTEEDIYLGAKLGIAEMIKSGTTCFADMYLHMNSVAQAVTEAKIRTNLSFGPITSAVRASVTGTPGLVVDNSACEQFVKKYNGAGNGLIKTFMEIHSVYLFDEQSIREAAALAKNLGIGIHIHLSESDAELAMSNEKYGMSPIEAAHSFGLFNNHVLAAHCVKLSENDIRLLKENAVYPVHNISSNLKLANGVAPVKRLIEENITVCLGTDGAASNNNLNLFEEMHLTALIHKGINKDPECLNAQTVINMATKNGAEALGFKSLGVIEKGSQADIILIDLNKAHILPVNNLTSAIVYSAQGSDVDTVIVNGEILMRHRELKTIDEEELTAKLKTSITHSLSQP
jgi:5-methylthioadenosine/S-adenosylhomocysteine deaminase